MEVKIQMLCWEEKADSKEMEGKEFEVIFSMNTLPAGASLAFLGVLCDTLEADGFSCYFTSFELFEENSDACIQCVNKKITENITSSYIRKMLEAVPHSNSMYIDTLQVSRIIRQEPVKRQPVL